MEPPAPQTEMPWFPSEPPFLLDSLDRAGAYTSHVPYGFGHGSAALDEQQRRNRARSTQAGPAMDDNATATFQDPMKPRRQGAPAVHRFRCRYVKIPDRKPKPFDTAGFHGLSERRYREHLEFVILDQGQDGFGAPIPDRIKVEIDISCPNCAKDAAVLLPGTKRDAQVTVSDWQGVNAERVGYAGPSQTGLLISGDLSENSSAMRHHDGYLLHA